MLANPPRAPSEPLSAVPLDLAAVKQRQQATWASGDFSVVASRIVLQAELLCEAVNLQADWRVLEDRDPEAGGQETMKLFREMAPRKQTDLTQNVKNVEIQNTTNEKKLEWLAGASEGTKIEFRGSVYTKLDDGRWRTWDTSAYADLYTSSQLARLAFEPYPDQQALPFTASTLRLARSRPTKVKLGSVTIRAEARVQA